MRRLRLLLVGLGLVLTLTAQESCSTEVEPNESPAEEEASGDSEASATVAAVVDGDTIDLEDGTTVRLVQVDAPEGAGECYGRQSTRVLRKLLPVGTPIELERDPKLDDVDRYGRLLRYVFADGVNVNLELVKSGAASVWFFQGERGKYARKLLRAAKGARAEGRGAWGKCEAKLTPQRAFDTAPKPKEGPPPPTPPPPPPPPAECDPSYPDFCIPPPPPDLDCADIGQTFTVLPPDPHGFDGNDNDGRGCESYG